MVSRIEAQRSIKQTADHGWEQRKLRQLIWVLVILGTVLAGKKLCPEAVDSFGGRVEQALGYSIDFEAVCFELGETLAVSGDAVWGLKELCVEVFGPQEGVAATAEPTAAFCPRLPQCTSGLLRQQTVSLAEELTQGVETMAEEDAVPAAGTLLVQAPEDAAAPPEGNTLDMLSLGELEYVMPVVGVLNSEYGYREHPVNGEHSFHSGVDIDAEAGDPIVAFADGVVEYTGEDSTYGRYLRLDHGDGIKSFYAHCREILVQPGQSVTAGETIAEVGATGRATGPHLHLELKCGEVHVDPSYYLDFPDAP